MAALVPVTVTVEVVAVPKIVELVEDEVYLYRDGRLLRCGSLDCILSHEDAEPGRNHRNFALRDHFDGSYAANDGPHVVPS